MDKQEISTILGIDLGINSVGWCLLEEKAGKPERIIDAGSRIFPEGINIDGTSGTNTPLNTDRREARQRRRQTERRAMRMTTLRNSLSRFGLLPEDDDNSTNCCKELWEQDPYELRSRALNEQLNPFEVGRAIYHLGQRRGFLSNRKSAPKENEERGKVKECIAAIEEEMEGRTYGAYMHEIRENSQHQTPVRRKYTSRQWFLDEFELIWEEQAKYHPAVMTLEAKKKIHAAIFNQRPLKSQHHLIGKCEIERDKRRAAMCRLLAKRVRLLGEVNNLRYRVGTEQWKELDSEQREALISGLEKTPKMTFAAIKKTTGLKLKGIEFNLQAAGRKTIMGNSVAASIIGAIGEDLWDRLSSDQRDALVEDLHSIQDENALTKRLIGHWQFTEDQAKALSEAHLEQGYASLSLKAMKKLLPLLEAGETFASSRMQIYGPPQMEAKPLQWLPPIYKAFELRNPVVMRSLSELRKVVNAIVKKYGKPAKIHIELARELKKGSRQREEIWKTQRKNEKTRQAAADKIRKELGIENPSRGDILRVQLAEECGWDCPYTGKRIKIHDLIGGGKWDIEHIIPFSRSLDNSYNNKTLCWADENRHVKKNRTPWETYGDTEKWGEIIGRVMAFRGESRDAKLHRFHKREVAEGESFIESFSKNQLVDTRYASVLARDLLAMFYGADWRRHIQVNSGGVTAHLRGAWGLNGLLNDTNIKSRDDHRHHAVDALVVALTDPGAVRRLSIAGKREWECGRPGRVGKIELPWENFIDNARDAIENIIVSHRASRKVNGQLHNDTIYGEILKPGTGERVRVLRRPIDAITSKEITKESIIDPEIRRAVMDKLRELDEDDPKKAFKDEANHPTLKTSDGKEIPIHRVRIEQGVTPRNIVNGSKHKNPRLVQTGNNHHLAIYKAKDKKGKTTWRGEVISRYDVMQRKRRKEPIIRPVDDGGNKLIMSLAIGDTVELDWNNERILCVVQKLSGTPHPYYVFKLLHDSRKAKDRKQEEIRFQSDGAFMKSNCIKKVVTPLGEVKNGGG